MPKGAKSKPAMRSWRVIEFAKKARHVATVQAATADDAIKMVIDDYKITDPHRQRRLVAQPIP
jgi:hypothetical protein